MLCVFVCCLDGALARAEGALESVDDALCRTIESSARASELPIDFLTRVIWRESSFRADAVSTAGAQGVAQFMPETSRVHGLADPFDPEQAIPNAAQLLSDLQRRFGNLGLAAAAYATGAARLSNWLHGSGTLSAATRAYVQYVSGRPVEEWSQMGNTGPTAGRPIQPPVPTSCMQVIAELRRSIGVQTASEREESCARRPSGYQQRERCSRGYRGCQPCRQYCRARPAGAVGRAACRQFLEGAGACLV